MKDYRIVYIKGEPRVVEWPDHKNCEQYFNLVKYPVGCNCEVGDQCKEFEILKEAAIAKGVPPADKELVNKIISDIHMSGFFSMPYSIQEGHPYSLEGYEVKVMKRSAPNSDKYTVLIEDVAVITPKEKETKQDEQGTMYY